TAGRGRADRLGRKISGNVCLRCDFSPVQDLSYRVLYLGMMIEQAGTPMRGPAVTQVRRRKTEETTNAQNEDRLYHWSVERIAREHEETDHGRHERREIELLPRRLR